ncbi:hypothetical protein ABIE24_001548 [Mycetocola sp. 2940]
MVECMSASTHGRQVTPLLPILGVAVIIAAFAIFLPLTVWGGLSALGQCPNIWTNSMLSEDLPAICRLGGTNAWLFPGAPLLTLAIVGLMGLCMIVLARSKRWLLVALVALLALAPLPYDRFFYLGGQL